MVMAPDFLAHFSRDQFACIAFVYTLAPFLSSARYGRFSEVQELVAAIKSSPVSAITTHSVFLSLLLAVFWIPARFHSVLPDWLIQPIFLGIPALDLVVLAIVIAMIVTEDKLIRSNRDS